MQSFDWVGGRRKCSEGAHVFDSVCRGPGRALRYLQIARLKRGQRKRDPCGQVLEPVHSRSEGTLFHRHSTGGERGGYPTQKRRGVAQHVHCREEGPLGDLQAFDRQGDRRQRGVQ